MPVPLSNSPALRNATLAPVRTLRAALVVVLACAGFGLLSIPGAGAQAIDVQEAQAQFDSGFKHSCAVRSGTVECWGANDFNQLGNDLGAFSTSPVAVAGITDAIAVSTGFLSTCALRSNGTVMCWGHNRAGELGNGTTTNTVTPVAVTGVTDATALSLGRQHGCVIRTNQTLKCWGINFNGRVGDGTAIDRLEPVDVVNVTNAVQVSAGDSHTCATLTNGTIQCWGGNFEGQLGAQLVAEQSLTAVDVVGISTAVQVSVADHSCAVLSDGAVECWGQNRHGQVGNGTRTDQFSPVDVGLAPAVAISAGYDVTCATLGTGAVSCWGINNNGETGNQAPSEEELVPTAAVGVANVVAANPASGYTCAVLSDSSVDCWGYNRFGQLGDNTAVDSLSPVRVGAERLMAISEVSCVNGDGTITATVTNSTNTARTYLVMFNNTTRGGTVAAQSSAVQTISGLVDTTIIVKVTETTGDPDRVILDIPEPINCDPGMSASAVTTCVDGNGVITVLIDNPTGLPLIYLVAFNNTRRSGLVGANSTAEQSIGGLVDTTFAVSVTNRTPDPDEVVFSEQVGVFCDSGGPEALMASVATTCIEGDGVITFSLENTALAPVSYLVSVNNTRRSGTLAAGASTTASVSGLADLTFLVKAMNTSPDPDVVLIDRTEVVNCSGIVALTAEHSATCQGMTGAITVTMVNQSTSNRWYRVTVNNTVRSSVVGPDSTAAVTFSGLANATFRVTATDTSSNPDLLLFDEQVALPCPSALTFTPTVACIDGNGQITVTIANSGDSTRSYSVFINNTRRTGSVAAGQTTSQVMGGLIDTTFIVRGLDTSGGESIELDTTVDVLCNVPPPDVARLGVEVRVAAERE